MEKIMGKREKVFALLALFIVNVLCLVKFLISFIRECKLINLIERVYSSDYVEYAEYVDFGSIDYIKVIMIIICCLAMVALLISLAHLFIKNANVKRGVLIVMFAILTLGIIFFFVSRLACGDVYSKKVLFASDDYYYLKKFGYEFHINAVYLIVSFVISLLISFIAFSLSNEYSNDQDKISKDEDVKTFDSEEERVLNEEINKLKAKIKIKDLESEYLKLKSKLDE